MADLADGVCGTRMEWVGVVSARREGAEGQRE